MQCPRCKGNNVVISREYSGSTNKVDYMRTGVKSSWFIPASKINESRQVKYRTVALCKECGNSWTVSSQSDNNSVILSVIVLVILIVLGIWAFKDDYNKKKSSETSSSESTLNTSSNDPTVIVTDKEIDTAIWKEEYTSIEEFEWSVDEDGITLGNYKTTGEDCKIRLSDRYTINGVDYHIYKLDGCFFCDDIKSVIVPEGVTEIVDYTFNSCKIKYLYLPSTLESFDGWNYFGDLKVLYYGGDEEQLNERFDTKDYLKNVKIEYNIDPSELK